MALNAAGVINNCNPRERLRNSTLVRSEESTLILPALLTRVTGKYGRDAALIFRPWFVGQRCAREYARVDTRSIAQYIEHT